MPKPKPREFRDDVVRVARRRDADVTLEQIADDFGIHAMTLSKWLRQAAIDAGERGAVLGSVLVSVAGLSGQVNQDRESSRSLDHGADR